MTSSALTAWIAQAKLLLIHAVKWLLVPFVSAVIVLAAAPYLFPPNKQLTFQHGKGGVESSSAIGEGLGLEEVILAVRSDLVEIQNNLIERQEVAMFEVDTFDIELSFVVKQTSSLVAEAGAPKFVVVSADSGYQAEQVQKIRLHFRVPKPPPVNVDITTDIQNLEEAIELK